MCPYHSEKPLFFKSDSLEENIVWEKNPNGSVLTYEILIYPFTQNFFGLWKRNRFWEGNYRLLIKLDNGKYIEKTFMIPPCS